MTRPSELLRPIVGIENRTAQEVFELPVILILLAIGVTFGIPLVRASQRADDRLRAKQSR